MSNITSNSEAAAVGVSAKNTTFKPAAEVIPAKILIIGTGDPATEAGNLTDTPIQIFSPEDVASQTGFGFMLHRLAIAAYKGSKGIETWMIQQPEDGAAVKAVGELDFTGSTGVQAGTLHLYIAGDHVPVTLSASATVEDIADAVVAAITADSNLPVTASKTAVTFEVVITAKSGGPYGNDISLGFNRSPGQKTPTGVTVAITDLVTGAGLPDIQDALDSTGTGDGSNEEHFTDVVHGYLQDSTTLDAVANYVGQGNDAIGLWDKVVHRPFVSPNGDVVAGSGGLSALVVVGGNRKQDRANGIIAVPGSYSHPAEIAAQAVGIVARISNNRPEQNYLDILLEGVDPGDKADRWTSEYNNRDTAVKAGISPTVVKSGAVYLQNVVTFYHPDDVPRTSNGYKSVRNIKIISNIDENVADNFEQEKWEGISIVSDVTRVTNPEAKKKARDTGSVLDDLVALTKSFYENAWIYDDSFTLEKLKESGAISVRTGGNGFDSTLSVILSGEGNILDTEVQFDTSIAVFL